MRFWSTLSLLGIALTISQCISLVAGASYTNPLKRPNGSDPFLVYTGGYYYMTTTTWTDIQITRARTLEGLKTGETRTVWRDGTWNRCCNVWAPEFHYFDGR
jgi:GH43 family beta-xylosidase